MNGSSRYRLVRTIASGGMAVVYEAMAQGERGFTRRVAVKRILPQHARDESMRRMFFDEASIAGRLHHANIVQVLDYGVVDRDDFLVMEYVDGVDADRAVGAARQRGDAMPEELALHVAAELAHALAYAHALTSEEGEPLGIVHRDVSPHNVLLAWDGAVKLADFGIALSAVREEKTATGLVKGKLAYMPPEQASGARVSGAADVHALGATLHALITGAPPRDAPTDPIELDPLLSPAAAELVRGCMADEPERRPTAAALAERAGRLAAPGARRALCEWLARWRDGDPASVSALDDLMGLALVASGRERRFTVQRAEEPPDVRAASDPSLRLPSDRRGPALVIGGALAITAAIVAYAGWSGEPSASETTAHVVRTEDSAPEEPPAPTAPLAPPAVAPSPPAAPIDPAPPPRPARARRAPRRSPAEASSVASQSVASSPAVSPDPEPRATTYLRVPRAGNAQERIDVDGRARGFTPALLEVASGRHEIVIRDVESGAIVLSRNITAEPHHTRVAPLVIAR